jgi:hypothetical protein
VATTGRDERAGAERSGDEEVGLPLRDAVRRFANPALLAEHDALDAKIKGWAKPGTPEYRRGWPDEDERHRRHIQDLRRPFYEARATAWRAVLDDFRRRLRAGELIASGFRMPLTPNALREDIAPQLWDMLRPRASTVKDGGLEMIRVRYRRAAPPDPRADRPAQETEPIETRAAADPGETGGGPRPTPKPRARGRGRPSIKGTLAAEMRRRATAGELRPGIGEECRALQEWALANVHGVKIPQPDSIEDALRDLYWELRGGKK